MVGSLFLFDSLSCSSPLDSECSSGLVLPVIYFYRLLHCYWRRTYGPLLRHRIRPYLHIISSNQHIHTYHLLYSSCLHLKFLLSPSFVSSHPCFLHSDCPLFLAIFLSLLFCIYCCTSKIFSDFGCNLTPTSVLYSPLSCLMSALLARRSRVLYPVLITV